MWTTRSILRHIAAALNGGAASQRLSSRRYSRLSAAEKSQLAHDRDLRRRKNAWEAGREYERYVGHLYEKDGWTVRFCGAVDGVNDRGRDLVALRDGVTHIIQCKRWSVKEIDEDVVFRFLGSITQYAVSQCVFVRGNDILETLDREHIKGVLVTTAPLSRSARAACEALGIGYRQKPLEEYPRIKCNVNADGTRIYHLPRDPYYDRIQIEPAKGELYAWTAAEAEAEGFRRARRPGMGLPPLRP